MNTIMLIPVLVLLFVRVECTPCTRIQSLNVTNGILYQNGSIFYEDIEYKSGSWYEVEEDGVVSRLGCPCIERLCVHKCCDRNSARIEYDCRETNSSVINPFSPPLYRGKERSSLLAHEMFFYLYSTTACDDNYLVVSGAFDQELYLQENGSLFEVAPGGLQWHLPTQYCVDMIFINDSGPPQLMAGVCYPENPPTNDDSPILYTAYAIGLLLSVPFLLATFSVYAFIPELRNLHGMCLMAYCAGLIVAFPLLAYLKLNTSRIGIMMTGCYVVAFLVYYAFQTSFFWLNVMCFDIWRTFRSVRPPYPMGYSNQPGYRGGGTSKRRDKRRFLLYGLYAWGIPLLLVTFTVAMQFGDLPSYIVKPNIGTRKCWFVDWMSDLLYFWTPVLVLVVCNVVFFSITAYRIRAIRQETAILKSSESSRSDRLKKDKQRYGLYLKLFMVMGVNWTLELVSFATGGSNWYWIVTDTANIGLGIFVFFIFVWKKKVRNLVRKKFNVKFGIPYTERDSRTGKWNTTSTAPTEDTRITSDDSAIRLKDLH